MKAISLWQPHATLLVQRRPDGAAPYKRYETRSWAPPRGLIGQRIAIHAGKSRVEVRALAEYFGAGAAPGGLVEPFVRALRALGIRDVAHLPLGAVVGYATLKACYRTDDLEEPGPFGDFSPGRYAWEMVDAVSFAQPVPVRGQQRVFNVPDPVVMAAAARSVATLAADSDSVLR